jgi:hypothetical protein
MAARTAGTSSWDCAATPIAMQATAMKQTTPFLTVDVALRVFSPHDQLNRGAANMLTRPHRTNHPITPPSFMPVILTAHAACRSSDSRAALAAAPT